MTTENAIYFHNRNDWRQWLIDNFQNQDEIWLIYPKKHTEKQRIPYNDAVEEALCFGWIDSIVKSYDQDHTMQRFSPRNPSGSYSQANKERLRWLMDNQLIHDSLIEHIRKVIAEDFKYPPDIINEIKRDGITWTNYLAMSETYKRIRIAYIESARKRPEEFKKRLRNFIDKTRLNKLISGFGGIDKYY